MKTKKILATTLAAIISISSLLGSTQGKVSAAYKPTLDYVTEYTAPIKLYTPSTSILPNGLVPLAYIRTYKKNSNIQHYEVVASYPGTKIRLYYDENKGKYELRSTGVEIRYEYDAYGNNRYSYAEEIKDRSVSFKPQTGVTVGGFNNVYLNGDVNCDRQIDASDVELVANHVKGKRILNGIEQQFANVCDETNPKPIGGPNYTINISDVTRIAAYVKGENVRL